MICLESVKNNLLQTESIRELAERSLSGIYEVNSKESLDLIISRYFRYLDGELSVGSNKIAFTSIPAMVRSFKKAKFYINMEEDFFV